MLVSYLVVVKMVVLMLCWVRMGVVVLVVFVYLLLSVIIMEWLGRVCLDDLVVRRLLKVSVVKF